MGFTLSPALPRNSMLDSQRSAPRIECSQAVLAAMYEFAWVNAGGEHGRLQPLWENGDRLYCRTWRNSADGVQQAFLAVLPAAEHPAITTINSLTHEFALKEYLDVAWAARPLELVQ